MNLSDLMRTLSVICAACGVLVLVLEGGKRNRFRPTLAFALDFWLAAGLLKLTADAQWSAVVTAALIVTVRKISSFGFTMLDRRVSRQT